MAFGALVGDDVRVKLGELLGGDDILGGLLGDDETLGDKLGEVLGDVLGLPKRGSAVLLGTLPLVHLW